MSLQRSILPQCTCRLTYVAISVALLGSQGLGALAQKQPRCALRPIRFFSTEAEETTCAATTPAHATALGDARARYVVSKVGSGEKLRMYFFPVGTPTDGIENAISPWHDIPLYAEESSTSSLGPVFNYVNEIPKGTTAKYEIATKEESTPIKQDVKNGKLRYFTYGKLPFNYGAIPQTWEDPNHTNEEANAKGDNDPIDVVELSPAPLPEGAVIPIRVLGALALIDEGELDWKLLGINIYNPIADLLKTREDIENVLPGAENSIREWFRKYKTSDGKPLNTFAFEEKVLNTDKAVEAVMQTHQYWKGLVEGKTEPNGLWVKKQN